MAVSGAFYPSSGEHLSASIKRFFGVAKPSSSPCNAIIAPHAGHMYSGQTAAYAYSAAGNITDENITAVFLGPNHTGAGEIISISDDDWETPLGISKIDKELAAAIYYSSNLSSMDDEAHMGEHSIEVQLPFLQHLNKEARIVCICMMAQNIDAAQDIGQAIFKAQKETKRNILLVASSDFTHFESAKKAEELDAAAMERIQVLDAQGFEEIVEKNRLSICGHAPIAAAMHYSKLKGSKTAELLKYTTSGAVTGDTSNVVAYAAFAVRK